MNTKKDRYDLLNKSVPAYAFGKYQMEASYKNLRNILNERKFRVGDTRVSPRIIFHWEKNNLIPEGAKADSDGWRKFSTVEMVWLRVVLHLRDFGLSLKRIGKVKDGILHWAQHSESYPYFEFCISQVLAGADIYIVVSADGSAKILFMEEIEMGKIFGHYGHTLLLSLRSILIELHQDLAEAKGWLNLSKEEVSILKEIRGDGFREVRAKVRDSKIEKQKVLEIENIKLYSENPPLEKIRKELQNEESFADVVTSFEHGKEQSVEVIKKKKPKKAIS